MSFFGSTSTPATTKSGGFFSSFGGGTPGGFATTTSFGNTGFGNSSSTTPSVMGFGTFSSPANTTTASNVSSFGNFGTGTINTSTPSMFGTSTTTPSFGAFGTAPSTTVTGTNLFGTNSTFGTGFGQQTTSAFGSFGPSFGKSANPMGSTFGGFAGQSAFTVTQPLQNTFAVNQEEAFAYSIFNVTIYGDERDTIIAKWNYLQSLWGVGKLYYSQTAPPVNVTSENCLCRFKAVGYSYIPGKDNKIGLVALNMNKSVSDLKAESQQILTALHALFGNRQNVMINLEDIKERPDNKSQFIIYVDEILSPGPNGTKRVVATELATYLNQQNLKLQLNNLGVIDVIAYVVNDEDQLKEYLETTPIGMDSRMWHQAKLDNPEPGNLIPVPVVGFNDLKWRIKCQEDKVEQHILYLDVLGKDLNVIKQRHATVTAKIMEQKRILAKLSHTILKIIVKQQCTRKVGLPLTCQEENLHTKLQNIQTVVLAPTQMKGRLSELLSQMRLRRNQCTPTSQNSHVMDKNFEKDLHIFLSMQQEAMEVVIDIVKKDLKALQIIADGMQEM